MIDKHLKKTTIIWERGLYIIKKLIMVIITFIFAIILGHTLYVKNNNYIKQQKLETALKEMQRKEEEIRIYKDQLEEFKKLNQQSDAQKSKIEELESVVEEISKEIETNKQQLENIKQQLK